MAALHTLLASARSAAGDWLATVQDPHAELLAMVWGPRFDREHALALWASQHQVRPEAPQALMALMAAADSFDRWPAPRQARLRRIILRDRRRCDNRPHASHPAD